MSVITGRASRQRQSGNPFRCGSLFIAVQLLDVFWSLFVLLGVEKVRIVPGFTATNPLDLYYMPYTHSLPAALLWAIVAAAIYYFWRRAGGWVPATLVGAAVFSHWVLDVLVHRPDMPLYGDSLKIGFGLWNYPVLGFGLELAVLFGGMYLYLKTTRAISRTGQYGMVIFGVLMLAVQCIVFFGPPLASPDEAAIAALFYYFVFAAIAYWLEGKRVPRHVVSGGAAPAAEFRHPSRST